MKLECTKKLLDYLGIKPEKGAADPNADPLFSWTANLILLNRRKTIVVTHVASHCAFLLYGVTAKHQKNIQTLILEGIRSFMEAIYIRPAIITQYLEGCERSITFAANSSRSAVAICNKSCEQVRYIGNLLDPKDLFQRPFLSWLNSEVIPKEGYCLAKEYFASLLEKRYGTGIQACRAVELEVSLELLTPCKRTLIVPDDLNFYQFHKILQHAFGWKDCHLHEFVLEIDSHGRPTKLIVPPYVEREDYLDGTSPKYIDCSGITLAEVFSSYNSIVYEYDFGDGWMHHIKLKGFLDHCTTVHPLCTEAIGDAPMEDSGGPYGFAEIMEILNQPNHPEYEHIQAWVSGTFWCPVDLHYINTWIKDGYAMPIPVRYD